MRKFTRKNLAVKRNRKSHSGRRLCRHVIERLENRTLLSSIFWTGGGDDTSWNQGSNWNTGIVPAASDDVTINTPGNPSIQFTSSAGNVTIQSLNSDEPIAFSGGSLTLTSGSSKITGALTITGGSITVTGSGTSFSADGNGTISNSSLTANAGANLVFPQATALSNMNLGANGGGTISFSQPFTYKVYYENSIQASGTGSKIDLSSMTSMTSGDSNEIAIKALAGGEVDLAGSVASAVITVGAAGDPTPSTLNVAAVSSLSGQSQTAGLTVNAGSNVTFPVLTSLSDVDLGANGGGTISFSQPFTYKVYYENSIQASGTGSKIDLSSMTSMTSGDSNEIAIKALAGGEVDLAGSVASAVITVGAAGDPTPSTLNVAAVSSLSGQSQTAGLTVNAGSNVTFPVLTSLSDVDLGANGGGTISFSQPFTYKVYYENSIQASGTGSKIDLSSMTSMTSGDSNEIAIKALAGGEVDLAGSVASAVITVGAAGDPTPSTLNVAAVSSLSGQSQTAGLTVNAGSNVTFPVLTSLSDVDLGANGGGTISFSQPFTYKVYYENSIQASGTGSKIDLSSMTSMTSGDSNEIAIKALAGGEVDLAGSVASAVITVGAAGDPTPSTLNVAAVSSLSGQSQTAGLTVNAGSNVTFPVLTSLSDVDLGANGGGTISFSQPFTYKVYYENSIQASGTGSKIDLSSMTSMTSGDSNEIAIKALAGGEVDLAGSVASAVITVGAAGDPTPSTLNVAAVSSLSGQSQTAGLTVNAGSNVTFPVLTSLSDVDLGANGGGTISFSQPFTYKVYYENSIQASGTGSKIDLSSMTSMTSGDSNEIAIKALAGGEVDLAGSVASAVITVGAAGDPTPSTLNVAAVSSLSNLTLSVANNNTLTLPASWPSGIFGGGVTLSATGTGSFLNLATISPASTLTVNAPFTNNGTLSPVSSGTFVFNNSLNNSGILAGSSSGSFSITGNLLGNTTSAASYAPLGTVTFNGSGTAASPQQLEVMSQDLGDVAAGFSNNFDYGTITLANNTYVQLVDQSDNSPGSGPEALYVNTLNVPAGTTLDLNGLHVYTQNLNIQGTVTGGSLIPVQNIPGFAGNVSNINLSFLNTNVQITDSVQESDGSTLVAGYTYGNANDPSAPPNDFVIVHIGSNGMLDQTFDNNSGAAVFNFGGSDPEDIASAIALDSSGNIIVAGTSYQADSSQIVVARLTPNGQLDSSFGNGGQTTISFSGSSDDSMDIAYGVAVVGSSIYVVGSTNVAGTTEFAIAKLNSSGQLDTSFNYTGMSNINFGDGDDVAYSVAAMTNGDIVVAGSASTAGGGNQFALAAFTSAGTLDTSFNSTGMVTTQFLGNTGGSDIARAVYVESNGTILAGGTSGSPLSTFGTDSYASSAALAAYNADGSLQTTFGQGGFVTTQVNAEKMAIIDDIGLEPGGDIVVSGKSLTNTPTTDNPVYDSFLIRYASGNFAGTTPGELDTSFNATGIFLINNSGIGILSTTTTTAADTFGIIAADIRITAADSLGGNYQGGLNNWIANLTGLLDLDNQGNPSIVQLTGIAIQVIPVNGDLGPPIVISITSSPETEIDYGATFIIITVIYADPVAINPNSFSDSDLSVINTANNQQLACNLFNFPSDPESSAAVEYRILAPGGGFVTADNGTYAISYVGDVSNLGGITISTPAPMGTFPVTVSANGIDLVPTITLKKVGSSVVGGSKGQATINIKNTSTTAMTKAASVDYQIVISPNDGIDSEPTVYASSIVLDLKPGQSKNISVSFLFPTTLPADEYNVVIDINYSKTDYTVVPERNYENDIESALEPVFIGPPSINLAVSVPSSLTIKAGKPAKPKGTVRATSGNVTATGKIVLEWVLSTDGAMDPSTDPMLSMISENVSFKDGQTKAYALPLTIDTAGTYTLFCVMDVDTTPADSDAIDNVAGPLTVTVI